MVDTSVALSAPEAGVYAIIWFLLWGAITVLLLNKYERRHGDEWISRVVSFLHAVLSTFLGALALYVHWPDMPAIDVLRTNFGTPTRFYEQIATGCTFSYFLVDLVGMWFGSYYDRLFAWHHICSAWGIGIALFGGRCGFDLSMTLVLMECSNPFLHGRWLMVHAKVDSDSFEFRLMDDAFFWTFTVVRVFLATYLLTFMLATPASPILIKVLGAAIMIFSYKYWVDLIGKRRRGEAWA